MPATNTATTPTPAAAPSADSVEVQIIKATWPDGFPQPVPSDSTCQQLTALPTMEVPQAETPGKPVNTPLRDTGSMVLLLTAVFLVVLSYRTGYKYIEQIFTSLFSPRRSENAFNDHTVNEIGILSALTLSTSVMEAIACFYAVGTYVPSLSEAIHHHVFACIGTFTAMALLFYVLQLGAYMLVGNVFSDPLSSSQWCDGFKAIHSLLGITLLPVVGMMLVWPQVCKFLLTIAIILYICCRFAFICKGFRIFYNKLPSLVYFILYLCSAEIVPLVLLSVVTVYVCKIICV